QTHDDPRLAAGTTRVLIGDLALFHDAGSLALTPGEFKPRIQVVVGNDGGGTIFDMLEVFETAEAEVYERVMRTPQQINIKSLAEAYGWEYRLVVNEGELERLFTEPVRGPEIVEVKIID
ncbi:MAG TPA: 2-succinyl-5-enolpyruvyl-6-hydroxy-3-cyclohexene-1-carboxylic-acid synthase, partial [Microbacteriaceae bacterium]|nr:2-succinyl-5-enolpyruvyl-6-hydroxy-3-cyclohexene-1-carboxylic-acid synthase [Microbacteriaceae bacterium]